MFRFSKYVSRAETLNEWVEWFKARGIKTEIRRNPNNSEYGLFREGEEALIPETEARRKNESP